MDRSLQFLLEACSGESVGIEPAQVYQRVCTDTRVVQPGDLFIALRGERFNGNAYAAAALQAGAVAAVVDEPVDAASVLRVTDARVAYGQLAAAHRREFELPVFGVAGSNGKTSTKDMLASVLGAERNVLRSEASFNNDVGVPATLLKLDPKHEAAVVELGTNHPGELAPLVQMAAPDYGVLTGIGREHLEFFGDLQGVAKEEGVLAELRAVGPTVAALTLLILLLRWALTRLVLAPLGERLVPPSATPGRRQKTLVRFEAAALVFRALGAQRCGCARRRAARRRRLAAAGLAVQPHDRFLFSLLLVPRCGCASRCSPRRGPSRFASLLGARIACARPGAVSCG